MAKKEIPMPMRSYLHQRGTAYYFRMRVPDDVARYYPQEFIKKSLGTSDYREACKRLDEVLARQLQEFSARRSSPARSPFGNRPQQISDLSDSLAERICATFAHSLLQDDDELRFDALRNSELPATALRADANAETLSQLRKIYMGHLPLSRLDALIAQLLTFTGVTLTSSVSEEQRDRLRYKFLKQCIRALEVKQARDQGSVINTAAVVSPASTLLPAKPYTPGPQHYDLVITKWIKPGIARQSPKTIRDYEATWAKFGKFLSYRDLHEVSRKDILNFMNHIMSAGAEYKTVDKKITQIKTLLSVATEHELIRGNPATGIKIPKPSVTRPKREPYSRADLNAIFSCPLYSEYHRPAGGAGEACVWLPVLALFHGARLEELGQLLVTDIQMSDGIWVMDIAESIAGAAETPGPIRPEKHLKNANSRRRVPIHPRVISMGFLDYVSHLRDRKHEELFPKLKPDVSGVLTGNWSKWWGNYARKKIGIQSPTKVFHSFRHSFKTECRNQLIPEDVHDAISGHTDSSDPQFVQSAQSLSSGRLYGFSAIEAMYAAIQKLEFKGVALPNRVFPEAGAQKK